jgi:hypothetical protein
MTARHNAHVIKWLRWRIWMAEQMGRPWAQTLLIAYCNEEMEL